MGQVFQKGMGSSWAHHENLKLNILKLHKLCCKHDHDQAVLLKIRIEKILLACMIEFNI